MQQGLGSLFWFVVVVAAIPLVLWLLKRSGYAGAVAASHERAGAPRTVATLALSPQQRVVTLELGQGDDRTWLVIGVSQEGIRTLHTMPAGPVADAFTAGTPDAAAAPPGFAALLSHLRPRPRPCPHPRTHARAADALR